MGALVGLCGLGQMKSVTEAYYTSLISVLYSTIPFDYANGRHIL